MERIIRLTNTLYQKVNLSKTGSWIVVFFILVGLFFGIRACSKTFEPQYYKIARDPKWQPLNLHGKEKNFSVFVNELLSYIGKEEQLRIEVFDASPTELFSGLDNGEFDGVIGSLIPNALNQEKYLFSDPLIRLGPVLIVPIKSNVTSLDDLKGKLIGFHSNSSLFLNTAYSTDVHIVPYDGVLAPLDDLDKGKIDAVIINVIPAYIHVKGFYSDRMKIITSPLTIEGLRLITRKDTRNAEFIEKFNEGLRNLKKSGEFESLIKKWSLIDPEREVRNGS